MIRWKSSLLLFIFIISTLCLYGENSSLSDLVSSGDGQLRFDPFRGKGLIFKDELSITFMVNSSSIVVNNERILTGLTFYRDKNDIMINDESRKILYRLLNIDQAYEEIINDENLYDIPVIIIDPGHGGRDSGAIGKLEDKTVLEKDVVLDIAKRVVNKLENNYTGKKILMTRSDDTFYTLEERVELANQIEIGKKQSVIYVSIHANASLNKKAEGFEVWYLPKGYRRDVLDPTLNKENKINNIVNALKEDEISREGEFLAKSILDNMDKKIGDLSSNRGLKEEIWFVVRKARMASVLIEVGFVTNPNEGNRLTDDQYLQKVCDGIYNGITDFISSYEKNIR